jgi:hypothetical protein
MDLLFKDGAIMTKIYGKESLKMPMQKSSRTIVKLSP